MYEPYFLQTQKWADFWQSANPHDHTYFWVSVQQDDFSLAFLVYSYPWHFGQKFWYVSKGGVLTNKENSEINNWDSIPSTELQKLFLELIKEVNKKAKEQKVTFVKYDFEEELMAKLGLNTNEAVSNLLKEKINSMVILSNKIIQYLSTMTLDLRFIQETKPIQNYNQSNLLEFWNSTQEFWKTTNSNVKRYTKKSIEKGWLVSTEKTNDNFEKFYKIYNHTKETRGFAIQSKEYLKELYEQDFSRIIIISNEAGEPHCVWFGIQIGNTQTYLYGGNTQKSFDDYGQYLVHLVALSLALEDKLEFYDLGGYDSNTGYGRFKDNYKGVIRTFPGVFDFPISTISFFLINFIINSTKKLKKLFGK